MIKLVISQSPIIASGRFILVWKTCSLYNKQKNTWVRGNTRFISRVEHDIPHAFAALTHEISGSTLGINLVFPRTHVAIIPYMCFLIVYKTLFTWRYR